jgi:hypothetical protein
MACLECFPAVIPVVPRGLDAVDRPPWLLRRLSTERVVIRLRWCLHGLNRENKSEMSFSRERVTQNRADGEGAERRRGSARLGARAPRPSRASWGRLAGLFVPFVPR